MHDKELLLRAVLAYGKSSIDKNKLETITLRIPAGDDRFKTYFIITGCDKDGDFVQLSQPTQWPKKPKKRK